MKNWRNFIPKALKTKDGSYTLYLTDLDETYHSRFGAVQESQHVFIKNGLDFVKKENLNILEIGLGTGLNVLLSIDFQEKNKYPQKIFLDSIEKYPLTFKLVQDLNYTSDTKQSKWFETIHNCQWNDYCEILKERFYLRKINMDLLDFNPDKKYDLIYFDAFAPDKQPEMWTKEIFTKLFENMNKNGVLVTFSAKGSVRRIMQSIGFKVYRIPGPPGKREMLRAIKV